jgi:hypothetical protein
MAIPAAQINSRFRGNYEFLRILMLSPETIDVAGIEENAGVVEGGCVKT